MEQLDRILRMEQILDEATEKMVELDRAVEQYEAIRGELQELAAYYSGPQWRRDYEDDSAGKFPKDLKRGVLSEDAVYDLLTEHDRLMARLEELVRREKAEKL